MTSLPTFPPAIDRRMSTRSDYGAGREGSRLNLYTIGFTRRSAADFFGTIRSAWPSPARRRAPPQHLHLAGFAKQDDLRFFLAEICQAEYHHELLLAPDDELLDDRLARRVPWPRYEERFLAALARARGGESASAHAVRGTDCPALHRAAG